MGRISYISKFDSAEQLDKIMYSYPGWQRGTVMDDQRSLTVLLTMLTQDELAITEHAYPYDVNIYDDKEMVSVYESLSRKARWKLFERTAIGAVRINALRQMREVGVPIYDDYISYREGQVNIHCGNIEPTRLLMNLVRHPELREFCIFTHPGRAKSGTAKYYCFDFSKEAHDTADRYQNDIFDYIRRKSEKDSWVIPSIKTDGNDSTE